MNLLRNHLHNLRKAFNFTANPYEGKVAVVTGGKNGNLGPIWVKVLKDTLKMKVFVIDLPEYDVTRDDSIEKARAKCLQSLVTPSIIVNNAAIDNPPSSKSTFFGHFQKIMGVNLWGAINVTEAFLPYMIRNGGGVVVNIGSIQGNIGADWRNYTGDFEKPVAYNCSKAALIQLSKSLTTQYGRHGIRSVTIAFGPFNGGKLSKEFLGKILRNIPVRRTVSKESLEWTMLYAVMCPELAGQQVLVDGGYTAW